MIRRDRTRTSRHGRRALLLALGLPVLTSVGCGLMGGAMGAAALNGNTLVINAAAPAPSTSPGAVAPASGSLQGTPAAPAPSSVASGDAAGSTSTTQPVQKVPKSDTAGR